jgi:hypothetical protein
VCAMFAYGFPASAERARAARSATQLISVRPPTRRADRDTERG